MNLKNKSKAVSKLFHWYISSEKNKSKLYSRITKQCIEVQNQQISSRKTRVLCYYPSQKPIGGYLIAPGLHPLGADHPRIDDFCMMLASLGYIVYSPYLSDYIGLYIVRDTFSDYCAVFDQFVKDSSFPRDNLGINIFSISFGSLMALRLASDKVRAQQINSVIIFGGFGNWRSTCDDIIKKALFGKASEGYGDIRSVPAIYNHLIEHIEDITDKTRCETLRNLWQEYMRISWVDDETYLQKENCLELANKLTKSLSDEEDKLLFMKGCGLSEGSFELYSRIIKQKESFEYLNPLIHAYEISCSVYLFHGKHDKLIPANQQKIIKEALPQKVIKRVILTKLYGHSDKNKEGSSFVRLFNNIREVRNLLRIILTLSVPKSLKH